MLNLLLLLLAANPASADAWCTWTDAPFTGWAHLRLPGTDLVWGQADGDRMVLTGQLLGSARGPVLQATLHQGGVAVTGDIDPADGLVFRAGANVQLRSEGLIAADAQVVPTGLLGAGVLWVTATPDAMAQVRFRVPTFGALPCEGLVLSQRFNGGQEGARAMAVLGVTASTERAHLKEHAVALRMEPDFAWVLTLKKVDYPREVAVLARIGRNVRIARDQGDGLVLYGWIRATDLMDPKDVPAGPQDGILGGIGGGSTEDVYRCEADLPLRARVGDQEAPVGTLAAGTAFEIQGAVAGGVSIRPYESWLFVEQDAALLLPAEAAKCGHERHAAMSIQDVLEGAAPAGSSAGP